MSVKTFGTMCDGKVVIQSMALFDVKDALKLLEPFFLKESICRGTELNLPESEESREELRELCRQVAIDGVSLVAKEVSTQKIVATCFNKILYTDDDSGDDQFFEKFNRIHCKTENTKCLMDYLITMDQGYDIFENYGIDCLFEILVLSTSPEFEGKKIGKALCSYSIDLARELKAGIGVELLHESIRNKRPKAVSALFTSKISQKIGSNLGFKVLRDVPYTEYSFKGKTFAERIGHDHPSGMLCCLQL